MTIRAVVDACGKYLPEKMLSNDDLAERIDTSDAWITERTGIKTRYIAADGEFTSDLGAYAARDAIQKADIGLDEIDLIVVATSTPDLTFPSTAAIIQHKLGIKQCAAFDVQAVCSGFVYGLSIVEKFINSGQYKKALLIGAETFSRILDWEDRGTCVLFGDGAGAFIISAQEADDDTTMGIISTYLQCDGSMVDLLYVDGGVSQTQTTGHLKMQGNKVFKEAVTRISEAMVKVSEQANIKPEDIDWFVPHQANQRILNGVAKKLNLRPEQVVSTVAMHGNTSAASIPLAFDHALSDGRIKRGDLVMLEAMGGGLTWGAALLRY